MMTMNERQITRRFSLSVASMQANGNVLNGTYRETV